MNRSSTLASIALASLTASATAQSTGWEPVLPDFRNIRGCNYIAEYASLANSTTPPPGYRGVASSTAMWRFASDPSASAEIDAHLDWIKGLGLNAVRIWISYPLWYADRGAPSGNRMLDAFAAFLTKCEQRNLYVMPVVWDDHCYGASPCLPPDYADPAGDNPPHTNLSHWIPNPGDPMIASWSVSGFQDMSFSSYLNELAAVARTSQAMLMWDVMNEPDLRPGDPNSRVGFLNATIDVLATADPGRPITIGFQSALPGSIAASVIQHPELDAISIHTYGTFRENVEFYSQRAAAIPDVGGAEMDKPVLITEIGQPGWGQAYKDVLNYVTTVNYGPPSDPVRHHGAGFFVFSAMCGWSGGNFPHREQHGLFFTDGKVRNIEACLSLQAVGIAQGVPLASMTQSFVQKAWTEQDHYFLGPLEDGHDFSTSMRNLTLPQWFYSFLPPATGLKFASQFDILGYDAATLSVGPNAIISMSALEYQILLLYSEVYKTGAIPGRTLTQLERNAVLDAWRFMLIPYVAQLTGPN